MLSFKQIVALSLALSTLLILNNCKSTTKFHNSNNTITVDSKNVVSEGNSEGDNIIFEGTDNIFDIIQKNVTFFDEKREIIIIKGSHNIIKLFNINIVDLSKSNIDTLIIVGNNQRYVAVFENQIINTVVNSNLTYKTETVILNTPEFKPPVDSVLVPESWKSVRDSLMNKIRLGDSDAYYELGEMYNYGLNDAPLSVETAIKLYEYGAVNNQIESIRRLGDIWLNGPLDIIPNKTKALYYYTLGGKLGDSYCQERLKEF